MTASPSRASDDTSQRRLTSTGLLILLRHGESTWNAQRRFTGWADPPLTVRGAAEATVAGRALASAGLQPDRVVTSVLSRALDTADLVTAALPTPVTVTCDWRLNERHYGALEGQLHEDAGRRWGEETVRAWRRGWADRPAPLDVGDPRHPSLDPRYADVPPETLPNGESLADCLVRQLPGTAAELAAQVMAGLRMLVIGHGNSLRALVAHLEQTPTSRVAGLLIPTGEPLVYAYDGRWRRRRVPFDVRGTWTGP